MKNLFYEKSVINITHALSINQSINQSVNQQIFKVAKVVQPLQRLLAA